MPGQHQALTEAAKAMNRPPFEVADIIRSAGDNFIERNQSHLGWQQLKVSSLLKSDADGQVDEG